MNSSSDADMFVTGCHRSGTSYLSNLLSAIIGYERSSDLDQTVDNPRGYFESTLLGPLNDELLRLAGFRWDRPPLAPVAWTQGTYLLQAVRRKSDFRQYALTQRWVDKDPRLSITLPFYRHLLLKRVGCAFILRHPVDVAMSLHLRDGFSIDKGLLIWFIYNRHCSTSFDPGCDILLSYERLLEAEPDQLERLVRFAGERCRLDDVISLHEQLTKRELRRSRLSESISNSRLLANSILSQYCLEAYSELEASGFEPNVFSRVFANLPAFLVDSCDSILSSGEPSLEYLRLQESAPVASVCSTGDQVLDQEIIATFAELIESLHRLKSDLDNQNQTQVTSSDGSDNSHREDALSLEIEQMKNSISWRVTAPLRAIRYSLSRQSR